MHSTSKNVPESLYDSTIAVQWFSASGDPSTDDYNGWFVFLDVAILRANCKSVYSLAAPDRPLRFFDIFLAG